MEHAVEADELRNCWAVRPVGALGTCGFHPYPWTVVFVKAASARDAIRKAAPQVRAQQERTTR